MEPGRSTTKQRTCWSERRSSIGGVAMLFLVGLMLSRTSGLFIAFRRRRRRMEHFAFEHSVSDREIASIIAWASSAIVALMTAIRPARRSRNGHAITALFRRPRA